MIEDCDRTEALLALLESTANLLRGMQLDPAIPRHAKEAMRQRVDEIEAAVRAGEVGSCS